MPTPEASTKSREEILKAHKATFDKVKSKQAEAAPTVEEKPAEQPAEKPAEAPAAKEEGIDLDEQSDVYIVLRRGRRNHLGLRKIVDSHDHVRFFRNACESINFALAHHLIRDQDLIDSRICERFRLE